MYIYIYIKTEIGTLISNIDSSNYRIKTETGTLFSNVYLSNYYTKSEVDDIDFVDNFYSKLKLIQH